jgi:hypothetical protein
MYSWYSFSLVFMEELLAGIYGTAACWWSWNSCLLVSIKKLLAGLFGTAACWSFWNSCLLVFLEQLLAGIYSTAACCYLLNSCLLACRRDKVKPRFKHMYQSGVVRKRSEWEQYRPEVVRLNEEQLAQVSSTKNNWHRSAQLTLLGMNSYPWQTCSQHHGTAQSIALRYRWPLQSTVLKYWCPL